MGEAMVLLFDPLGDLVFRTGYSRSMLCISAVHHWNNACQAMNANDVIKQTAAASATIQLIARSLRHERRWRCISC